jgi:beta-lactamase regulating signal transducer with metallopeptidase domain
MIPDSFFSALLNQVIQVSCVAVLAILVTRWTRGTRPHLVHAVWLIVFLKCITPPVLSSPTSPFSWLQAAIVDSQGNRSAFTFNERNSDSENRAAESSSLKPNIVKDSPLETGNESTNRWLFKFSSAWQSFGQKASSLSSIQLLVLCWLIVAGAIFAIFTLRFLTFLRWVNRTKLRGENRCEYSMRLNGLVARIEVKLGMRHRTRVEVVDALIGPAIVGIIKPTILLPKVIVDRIPDKHLETLIAHELVHFRRGDLWWSALQTMAVCGYWFHPLIWLARSVMNREAEKCCDEETIGSLKCEPGEYARCLISVLECKHLLRAAPLLPGVRPVDVTVKRLERIMRLRQGCHSQCPSWVRITLVVGAITLLPGAALTFAQQTGDAVPTLKTDGATPLPLITPKQQASPDTTVDQVLANPDYKMESMDITAVLSKLQETEGVPPEQAASKLLASLPSPKAQVEAIVEIDGEKNAVKMGGDYPSLKIAGNRLYVLGTENERSLIRKYLEHYRHFGNQFLVYEVRILDVPTESLDALALRWDWQQTTKEKNDPNETIKNGVVPASFASTRTLSTSSKVGQFDSSQIKALLNCDRCNILMAPKISGLNSQSTKVHSGSERSFVVGHAAVMGEDGMPTNTRQPQIELVEEGVKLELEGRAIENDPSRLSVRLKITHTEILDVWESTIEKGGQEYPIQQPRVSSKFIETGFEQKLGLTFAIAGEPEMVESVVERGVPIFARIPYVNRLFKNVAIHSELRTQVVLVTCSLQGGKQ